MNEPNASIGFIFAGVFGKGLALALATGGHRVSSVHSRSVPAYGALAAATLPIAAKRGLGPVPLAAMQGLIDHYAGEY